MHSWVRPCLPYLISDFLLTWKFTFPWLLILSTVGQQIAVFQICAMTCVSRDLPWGGARNGLWRAPPTSGCCGRSARSELVIKQDVSPVVRIEIGWNWLWNGAVWFVCGVNISNKTLFRCLLFAVKWTGTAVSCALRVNVDLQLLDLLLIKKCGPPVWYQCISTSHHIMLFLGTTWVSILPRV